MCDCPEIQGKWAVKEGDFYYCFCRDLPDYPNGYGVTILMPEEADVGNNELIESDTDVWLPRQDQIQNMLLGKFSLDGMLDCFNSFWNRNAWLSDDTPGQPYPDLPEDYGIFYFFESVEQLWLAFYMKEMCGKIWDGDRWIAIEP
jgi:hypothetical protein